MSQGYAELHCLSNFSFQRGASSADELFQRAKALGYGALAITDECTLAGIVRAWQASKAHGLPLIVGCEMPVENGPRLVLLAENKSGYQALCRLVTHARRRAEKGHYRLRREDFRSPEQGLLALWLPAPGMPDADAQKEQTWLRATFGDNLWLAVELHSGPDDRCHLRCQLDRAANLGLRAVACGDVHMHSRGRRALQDTMTAIRHHTTVAEAGHRLFSNGERHLRPFPVLQSIYPPELLEETRRIGQRCTFDLGELEYEYPREIVPEGQSAESWLRELTEAGARTRWPDGVPAQARANIEKELGIIRDLKYESYFLTVHDIVAFARRQRILCQGRGSAANSTVCFALGITELDPAKSNLLFERFMSMERKEPPDIDVDFEHERREEVIQYIFNRYGRTRAALTAVVSTYHGAGAIRDVAKALGLPADQVGALADCCGRWSDETPPADRLREAGFDPDNPSLHRVLTLTGQLIGFPRHLSQHPGGFVISEHPLQSLVPVENASMADRTVIQWDKDDLDAVGLLKVDILALGMLTALRRTFDLIERYRGKAMTLAGISQDDPETYDMICRADTVGVFQIESRAQMAMLPRLQPREFYDLVIEVAIVRPGPIQGDMVHPYLKRREDLRHGKGEPVYENKLEKVFKRTLGIPLFQEQVMEVAIIAADYSAGEADNLRRSMAAWKRNGGLEPHRQKLAKRLTDNGYPAEFAARLFEQIKGFGSYGFPESHAASFALLAYASSWLKCHEPAAFACALINSWPMGFYTPDQVLQDARRHHLETHPVDVRFSDWDCSLEPTGHADRRLDLSIRLGLRLIRGFRQEDALRIEAARAARPFADATDLCVRAGLDRRASELLADAGALRGLLGHRHRARWEIAGVEPQLPLFGEDTEHAETPVNLPLPSVAEDLRTDYDTLGTTLGPHPMAMLRQRLARKGFRSSRDLLVMEHEQLVNVCGLVIGRQRPGTASGVIFVTLEDEFGMVNVVVWRDLGERQRKVLVGSQLMQITGRLESKDGVRHVIARRLTDLTPLLQRLDVRSRDFR